MTPLTPLGRWGWLLPVTLFLALTLPTIDRAGIAWDEQTDLDIARSYLTAPGEWLRGSEAEPTQTRLPMYGVAVVYRLLGSETLRTARIVSCLTGAIVIIGVYVYAASQLGPAIALIASLLLAGNPFFVAFARVGFTEGDVYVTAAMIWLLVCAARMTQQRTVGWAALTGFALGIALSAKFLAVAMVPVIAAAPWLPHRHRTPSANERRLDARDAMRIALLLACTGILLAGVVAGLYVLRPTPSHRFWVIGLGFAASVVAALVTAGYLISRRHCVASPLVLSIAALGSAAVTFVLVPPVHLTNTAILAGLKNELLRSAPLDPFLVMHAAQLHFLCVLIKPSPLVGAAMWIAFASCVARARRERWLMLPVLMTSAYLLLLLKMNLAQSFYTMPILPLLTILCAEQWTWWVTRRRWLAVPAVAACVLMATDLARSYPDYQLNGYQWLGARYIGTVPTLAYRGVAQLTTDGIQQSFEWVNAHVPDRAVVRTYIYANHLVRALSAAPRYQVVDGLTDGGDIDRADYVVTSLHAEVGRGWATPNAPFVARPYDRDRLNHHFERVYVVDRAFGLEVAAVWRHRPDGDRPAAMLAR